MADQDSEDITHCLSREEIINLSARRSVLRNDLMRLIRLFRGTAHSSAHPNSLGDRMSCTWIALGLCMPWDMAPLLAKAESLVAEGQAIATPTPVFTPCL